MLNVQKKHLTKEQAVQKLKQYCSYQERCHLEVSQKLWELGVASSYHDEIISALIEENYLNEERFAIMYAGGKFRMKQWGRKKIIYSLKEKKISEYCIKKALNEIDEEDYLKLVKEEAEKKYSLLKSDQFLVRKKKTIDYLLQKGFEADIVFEAIKELTTKK